MNPNEASKLFVLALMAIITNPRKDDAQKLEDIKKGIRAYVELMAEIEDELDPEDCEYCGGNGENAFDHKCVYCDGTGIAKEG